MEDSNYSNIRKTAQFIQLNYPGHTVVSDSQLFGTPLYAYLKPQRIYFPAIRDFSYFTSWERSGLMIPSELELIQAAERFEQSIIVTSFFPRIVDSRVKPVKFFDGAIWGDNYQVYEIIKPPTS
jgi:hypothetical protein